MNVCETLVLMHQCSQARALNAAERMVRFAGLVGGQQQFGRGVPHLYFIRAGKQGPVKIGSARVVKERLSSLQSGNPEALEVLAVIRGAGKHERAAHEAFAHLRIRGEWFECRDTLEVFLGCLWQLESERQLEETASGS